MEGRRKDSFPEIAALLELKAFMKEKNLIHKEYRTHDSLKFFLNNSEILDPFQVLKAKHVFFHYCTFFQQCRSNFGENK